MKSKKGRQSAVLQGYAVYFCLGTSKNPIPDNNAAAAPIIHAIPMSPNIINPIIIPTAPKIISKIPITFILHLPYSFYMLIPSCISYNYVIKAASSIAGDFTSSRFTCLNDTIITY